MSLCQLPNPESRKPEDDDQYHVGAYSGMSSDDEVARLKLPV